MASFAEWQPETQYLQSGGTGFQANGVPGMKDATFLSGAYTGLFAGPPRLATAGRNLTAGGDLLAAATNALVYPVGLTQQFSVSHQRQFSRIFEIGSERSYWVSGRTMGQIGLGRALYHGPSLLRTLYAYYSDLVEPGLVPAMLENFEGSSSNNIIIPPGFENFYANLASDLFSQPVGLLSVIKDTSKNTYGMLYFEACVIPNHSLTTDAQGVLVNEQAGMQFERAVPISSKSVKLIR